MHNKPPGNQKNLMVITIYGIGGILVFWSRKDLKGFLPCLGMAASWSQDNEVSEYDQEIPLSVAPDQPTIS